MEQVEQQELKASELRITNYVTIENKLAWPKMTGIPVRIIAIENGHDKFFPNSDGAVTLEDSHNNQYSQFLEFVKPIPLSEEWLIKFGFEKIPHLTLTNSFIKSLGRNRIICVGNVGTANEMIWLCEVNATDPTKIDDLICIRNFDYDGRTYVHHLQNIWHSHANSELTLKDIKEMTKEEALNILIKDVDTNKISDGYHSFGELYEHRIELFIQVCKRWNALPGDYIVPPHHEVWRSRFHSDGKLAYGGGWFVLGIGKAAGHQITYHLPDKYWDSCSFAETLDLAPEFDGHTPNDVLNRLKNL